jgi:hypothetical protein
MRIAYKVIPTNNTLKMRKEIQGRDEIRRRKGTKRMAYGV